MKGRIALLGLVCVVAVVVPVLAGAGEEMVLQAQPRATLKVAADLCDTFYVCSYWHELSPNYCTIWHVIYCGPAIEAPIESAEIEKAVIGRELKVENGAEVRRLKIERIVPQYHLGSGAVVEPRGEWNPKNAGGEEWLDVRSGNKQSLHVANWEDSNGDGLVGAGDRVVFKNGRQARIKAVRLGVHTRVLEVTSRK